MRNATARNKDSAGVEASNTLSEMFPTIELDEVSISDDVTLLPSKGKRKVSSKKAGAHGSNSVAYAPTSPANLSTKPLKSIKQEKN
ncbi:hypothetical protein K1719_047028 [Acacia pycnantha]|nr:hypothetical protein K1719_047028 [Acacia pycnantha]